MATDNSSVCELCSTEGYSTENALGIDGRNATQSMEMTLGYVYFNVTAVVSVLSMIGSIIIVLTYVKFKELRTTGRELLVYLSLADFLTAFGNLLGIIWFTQRDTMDHLASDIMCSLHATLTFFSSISSFLWTVVMAIHLYVCIVRLDSVTADRLVPYFHAICWLVPGVVGVIPWSLGVIGHDKALRVPSWCWIDPSLRTALFWQYFSGKAWEIASYIIVVVLYARIKAALCRQVKRHPLSQPHNGSAVHFRNAQVISEANKKLTFVPAVFIALRIWGTLRFLVGAHLQRYVHAKAIAWVVPLQGIGDSAQGFANCILFCLFTAKVRKSIKQSMCSKKQQRPKYDAVNLDHSLSNKNVHAVTHSQILNNTSPVLDVRI